MADVQFAASTMGYYTYAAQAQDAAGNLSESISRVAVHDISDTGRGLDSFTRKGRI